MKKYIIIAATLTLVILLFVFRDKIKALFTKAPAATPPAAPAAPATPAPGLDYNRLLKKGVNGAETKLLQTWLGITADGIFGTATEAALYQRKGVKETTLNNFAASEDLAPGEDSPGTGYAWLDNFFDVFSDQEPTSGAGGTW